MWKIRRGVTVTYHKRPTTTHCNYNVRHFNRELNVHKPCVFLRNNRVAYRFAGTNLAASEG